MQFTAEQLAYVLKGTIEGDPQATISNYAKIEEGRPGTLSFLSNLKYEPYLYSTEASIVLVNKDFQPSQPVKATLIRVKDAYMALATLMKMAEKQASLLQGIHKTACVSKHAKIAKTASIGAFVYIADNVEVGENVRIFPYVYLGEGVKVGKGCILYPHVTVYRDCEIGEDCILHASCVIGSDGFGFARDEDGSYVKMPQNGRVIVGNRVEIGASTTIDRGSMGPTLIHDGVKLDNQIQVAHNVEIGENTAIAACSGVAGSTKIGKNCILAGKVGVVGHISLTDQTTIAAGSNVTKTLVQAGIYQGSPAIPIHKAKRSIAVYRNLPELQETVTRLSKEIAQLKSQLPTQTSL